MPDALAGENGETGMPQQFEDGALLVNFRDEHMCPTLTCFGNQAFQKRCGRSLPEPFLRPEEREASVTVTGPVVDLADDASRSTGTVAFDQAAVRAAEVCMVEQQVVKHEGGLGVGLPRIEYQHTASHAVQPGYVAQRKGACHLAPSTMDAK